MKGNGSGVGAQVSRIFAEYPVRIAFLASVLLSLIAVACTATVARDAALYIDIAQKVIEQGPKVAWQSFDWPWFSLLLAATHTVLHIPLELSAYLWCGLFFAGTSALMVDCIARRSPHAAKWACLVVLAMPAFNSFRNDIIRECGFWFFCTLALWLVLRWHTRGGWLRAALIHLSIVAAVLFRLEAVLLLPAIGFWLLSDIRSPLQRVRLLQFSLLPAIGLIAVLALGVVSSGRVSVYLGMINPHNVFASFGLLSDQFANSLVNKYSRDEAGQIIFFGVLASLLISFVKLMGPFSVPFLWRRNWGILRAYWHDYRPFAWAALLYLVVLMLFFLKEQFMNSRYLSFLNLLFVPALALALEAFVRQFPRWGKALVAVAVLVMLANVVSFSPGKTHYVEAGRWMQAHTDPSVQAYYEDGRMSYYAGRGYVSPALTREEAMSAAHAGDFSYFLIEAHGDEPPLIEWMTQRKLRVIERFANRKGATVLVIGP